MKTSIKVSYNSFSSPRDEEIARFTSKQDAFDFSKRQFVAEVSDKSGLIGQFKMGKATEEFSHLNEEA